MTTKQLAQELGLKTLVDGNDKEIASCYISDMLSRVMGSCGEGDIWITVQTSLNMAAVALMADAACVIFPEGLIPPEDTINKSKEEGLALYSSEETAYAIAVKLAQLLG